MPDQLHRLNEALSDRYAIERELGAGGMATVYLARDVKHERQVALKVLRPELAAVIGPERFLREIKTTANLHHPHILALYDSGEADAFLYYVMPYVEGESLRDRLDREKPLAVKEALEIAMEVADALSYAHGRGLVHRDIKPENILLESRHALLADFGIARAVSSAGGDRLTATGIAVGTPAYMSPEQVAGESELDGRSDLYSLGCVLFEMLTGNAPFTGPSLQAVLAKRFTEVPPDVSVIRPEVPRALAVLLRTLLAREPGDRFATADDVVRACREGGIDDRAGPPAPIAAAAPRRSPLVGRDAERAALHRMLVAAQTGRGGLVLLGGEPGVGKTRLAAEILEDACARGMLALTGHAYEDETAPFVMSTEILGDMVRKVPPDRLRDMLGDDASEISRFLPELRTQFADIPEPQELPPEQRQRLLFRSALEFLKRASREQPMVMLLDDINWADASSMLLLEHVAAQLERLPVLIIGTYRDAESDIGEAFANSMATLVRQRLAERIPVKQLDDSAVAELLAALGGANPPSDLVAAIVHATEGNAFFVEEVFRHLSEEGALFDDEGRWRSNLAVDTLDVPEGVRLVTGRRLKRLSAATQTVLTTAAVVGLRFDLQVLEAAAGDGEATLEAVEEAEAARLILPAGTGREEVYEFSHALVRQTLVSALSKPRLKRLHLSVADALERVYGRRAEDHAAELAYHLYQAGAIADPQKAIRHLLLAAEQALHTSASGEALQWLEKVQNMQTALRPEQRGDLYFLRGLAERGLGRWSDFARDWTAALEIYERTGGQDTRIAQIGGDVSYHMFLSGEATGAVEIAERALQAVTEDAARCQLLGAAGFVHGAAGEPEKAEELLARATELAQDLANPALFGATLSYQMQFQWAYMRAGEASETGLRAAELLREAGSPWQLSNCLALTLMSLHWAARFADVAAVTNQLEALSVRVADHGASATTAIARLFSRIAAGRLDEAETLAAHCLEQVSRAGFPSHGHDYAGMVAFWRGRWDDARRSAQQAVDEERTDAWRGWDSAHHIYVESYLAAAAAGEAGRAGVERVAAVLRERQSMLPRAGQQNPVGSWGLALAMVEAASVLGQRNLAAELFPLVREALAAGAELAFSFGLVRKLVGIAATAAGHREQAEEHYDAALRQARELPHRIEEVEVQRWYARMLLERNGSGDRERAQALLTEARRGYKRIGMPRHVVMVDSIIESSR